MGMDVYGRAPTAERSTYFRNNVWWWHPLWAYCEELAPDLIPASNLGHSNDGWGLNRRKSRLLSDRLIAAVDAGETAEYARQRDRHLQSLPQEKCEICDGTGSRAEPPAVGPGSLRCNGCNGQGWVPNFATWYRFDVDNVRQFAEFLRDCGGFRIC